MKRARMCVYLDVELSNWIKKNAMESYSDIVKLIDQVKSKGIIHKNKANNKKSKLSRHLTQMK